MSLGENIKKRRREMNLTQEQLGDALNVHANTIRKWEKGISHPDTLELEQIAKILNVSISYLYAETSTTSRTVKFVKNSAYQDRTEINDNSVPSMAYWGSLVDNAEKTAENGRNIEVIIDLVKTALTILERSIDISSERHESCTSDTGKMYLPQFV